MEKITFELEFITPAFIGGADSRKADLRPASFIGLLRWWWRVVLATFLNSSEEIFKYESELMGSQEKASNFFLKIKVNSIHKEELNNMLYMAGMGLKGRTYIKPCSKFSIEILCDSKDKEILENLIKLSLTFGGIGSRSRKGFGNMAITEPLLEEKDYLTYLKPSFWEGLLKNRIPSGRGAEELPNLRNLVVLKKSDMKVNPEHWQTALSELGNVYRRIRLRGGDRTPEYYSFVGNYLRGGRIDFNRIQLKNLPFGLPINFQSRSMRTEKARASALLDWVHKDYDDKDSRRASSVIFVFKQTGLYTLVFKSRFLPVDAKLRIRPKGKYWQYEKIDKPRPKYFEWENQYQQALSDAINELKKNGFREISL